MHTTAPINSPRTQNQKETGLSARRTSTPPKNAMPLVRCTVIHHTGAHAIPRKNVPNIARNNVGGRSNPDATCHAAAPRSTTNTPPTTNVAMPTARRAPRPHELLLLVGRPDISLSPQQLPGKSRDSYHFPLRHQTKPPEAAPPQKARPRPVAKRKVVTVPIFPFPTAPSLPTRCGIGGGGVCRLRGCWRRSVWRSSTGVSCPGSGRRRCPG